MSHHVISTDDYTIDWLDNFFIHFLDLKSNSIKNHSLAHKTVASLFYEPSTRTRLSFEAAASRLGIAVIGTENAKKFSSTIKGESLEDTIRVLSSYVDAIILRHSETGAAKRAAEVSSVPIINAGDGRGEHPTQALLDLCTIWEHFGPKHSATITFVGDLKNGRTVHSLIRLMTKINEHRSINQYYFNLIAPKKLKLNEGDHPDSKIYINQISNALTPEIIERSDVIYMTRTQTERGSSNSSDIILTMDLASHLQDKAIIMHPLPRNHELPDSIDTLPQAHYFKQAENGLYVRQLLLEKLLSD